MKRYIVGFIIALVLCSFALRPLVQGGFFSMHDDTQVGRVVAMGRALRLGQFPVRWVSDLGYGYGYPIYNFYGPLPYYAGGTFYALGFSGLVATKIMFALGIVGALVSMYILTVPFFGVSGAILSSVLYTYAPYHAIQIYIRGAVGEFWAYAFLPILLLGMRLAYVEKTRKHAVLAIALGIFGVVTSHTIMGYVVVGVLGAACLLSFLAARLKKISWKPLSVLSLGLVMGLGLSAFFWLPAMAEKSYTNVIGQIGPTAMYADHFVCLTQLWDSAWGFGGTTAGCIDGMSFRLGKPHILLALVGLLLWGWSLIRKKVSNEPLISWAIVIGVFSIFMMTQSSVSLWGIIPNMAYVQYPWRLLMFAVLGLSILGASIVLFFRRPWVRLALVLVLIFEVIMVYGKLFVPQTLLSKPVSSYETEEELRYRVSKISDEYLPPEVVRPIDASQIVHDTIAKTDRYIVKTNRETDTYGMFTFDTPEDQMVQINKAYFPGWVYVVNGKRVEPVLKQGLPQVIIPKGVSTLQIYFRNTGVRNIGNILSIASWSLLLLYYGKNKKINT